MSVDALVRFDSNDYSVPVRWAHHPIVVKGYWQEVVLCAQGKVDAPPARAALRLRTEACLRDALLSRDEGGPDLPSHRGRR